MGTIITKFRRVLASGKEEDVLDLGRRITRAFGSSYNVLI